MKNDETIATALKNAVTKHGSNAEIARLSKIDPATIGMYRNGLELEITEPVWDRLYRVINQWLPDSPYYRPRSLLKTGVDVTWKLIGEENKRSALPLELAELAMLWPSMSESERAVVRSLVECAKQHHVFSH